MKKIICKLFGHKFQISKCPVTGIELKECIRCKPQNVHRGISFS